MAEFNYSADAVCRWRFQLWVAMLSRPNTTRIDSVLYHLVDVIEPQVRVAMEDAGMEGAGEPFSLDTIENGHINATGHPYMSPRKIGSKLFYVHRHDNLQSRTITDTHLNVCYCEVFMRRGLCEHLIFCAPDDIHHPQLPKLLCEIPDA
ncbi:hypothetical protein EC988_009107 [Linderina pennispora]|nr:hypothetical protein EC988_009107 [Linderina pennispora]